MAGQFRILYYSDALNTGGAEGYITNMARAAVANGYRAEAAMSALPALDAWAEELRRSGLAVHRLTVIRSLRNPGPFLRQLGFFLRHRYHLIHFNQVDPWSCAGGILAARLAGQSGLVSTDHLPNTVYEVPVPFRARMAPYLLRRRIVSAECHLASMPDPAAARRRGVRVVRNGVSLADPVTPEERATLRARLDLPSDSPAHAGALLVGTVGRLTGQKDHQTLVRAAVAVPGAAFAIIGDGPERGRLEALRDRLGLQDRFHLLGRRPDGGRLMRAFDVFAFPSLYEGMPFALLEAMSAGLAIVASAVPEIQEMIRNEEHGLLVPPSDPDALALALKRMLDAPAQAAGWGAAARARTAAEFTKARMARETLAVYARCARGTTGEACSPARRDVYGAERAAGVVSRQPSFPGQSRPPARFCPGGSVVAVEHGVCGRGQAFHEKPDRTKLADRHARPGSPAVRPGTHGGRRAVCDSGSPEPSQPPIMAGSARRRTGSHGPVWHLLPRTGTPQFLTPVSPPRFPSVKIAPMAQLRPYPLGALVRHMFRELDERQSIFGLPSSRFYRGHPARDFSVPVHDTVAGSPLGPAAGPHTQMAQNIVLSWLAGSRVLELKTVQVLDDLAIPRPCIDMETVGFNTEWSQELRLEQSLEEYVKGAMLIAMLQASGRLEAVPGFDRLVLDISVGYDLEGIRSARVRSFIQGMQNATPVIDRLRREIPAEFAAYRELDYPTQLTRSVTLSTFHGCPPDEIERIIEHLMKVHGLHCVVKFNPTLLGHFETLRLLHQEMGYEQIHVPLIAFKKDTRWDDAIAFMDRLGHTAARMSLSLGAKFCNTLIVDNVSRVLPPSEKEVYLSGPPLYVLALQLVRRFRDQFGDRFPISFAAGINRSNFPDAVALGLAPVTLCTDLLTTGGYGRLPGYHRELASRMAAVGATTVGDFIIRVSGQGEEALASLGLAANNPVWNACRKALREGGDLRRAAGDVLFARWVSAAALRNTEHLVPEAIRNPRYTRARNARPPRKVGSRLSFFDCLTCDKCVPVCPNNAIFTYRPEVAEVPSVFVRQQGDRWVWRHEKSRVLTARHQIGVFADFCNECGNCDVFCPEDGGPFCAKPRFFFHGRRLASVRRS